MDDVKDWPKKIKWLEGKGTALSFILFSVFFVMAQLMHGDIFELAVIGDGRQWIAHFRGQTLLHYAHFFEFICSYLLVIMALHYKKAVVKKSPFIVSAGVYMVFIGSFMLLANKSALCLTISGFDTLSDAHIQQIVPALDVLLQKKGLLFVLRLLPLLPLGYVLIGIALFKTRYVPVWQSIMIILGSLMLANPEIEVLNFIASFLLAGGLLPYGYKLLFLKKMEKTNEIK